MSGPDGRVVKGDGTSVIIVSWLHSVALLGILWYTSPIILQPPAAVRIATMGEPDMIKYGVWTSSTDARNMRVTYQFISCSPDQVQINYWSCSSVILLFDFMLCPAKSSLDTTNVIFSQTPIVSTKCAPGKNINTQLIILHICVQYIESIPIITIEIRMRSQ